MDIFLATKNLHKTDEFRALLPDSIRMHSCQDLPREVCWQETGHSFASNAKIKAHALVNTVPPGSCILADDSGLEVAILAGAPGIYSQRFSGPLATDKSNNQKLLRLLSEVPAPNRCARFVCCLCYIDPRGNEMIFEGKVEGSIALKESGEKGFGYDPLFIPNGQKLTFAELSYKNNLSHRFLAVKAWLEGLKLTPSSEV